MPGYGLILTLTGGLSAALLFGYLTHRIGLSPIVGYLAAGLVVGPYTPGFVADAGLAEELAEVGVILLMFGVGLQFHLAELLAVRNTALPGAMTASGVATLLGSLLARAFGWEWAGSLVFGYGARRRQHGRARAGVVRPQPPAHAGRPRRGRLAGGRGPVHGGGAGAAPGCLPPGFRRLVARGWRSPARR